MRVHSDRQEPVSIPTEPVPISNARLVAELQALSISIHMFGLGHVAHLSQGRTYDIPPAKQVKS